MNLQEKLLLYFHTLRYLRPTQFWGRLVFRIHSPGPEMRPAPRSRLVVAEWGTPVTREQSQLSETIFRFLSEEHEISSGEGWNAPNLATLWLYNLHYFDDLNAHDAKVRHAWHLKLLKRWILENPPPVGVGWEPYPLSLRVVNWMKWVLAGNVPTAEMTHSLAVQLRFLTKRLEVHLLGNHLLANAKALLFGGLFFEGAEADRWFEIGLNIIDVQLKEQILPDGGHFELSPMYHSVILEDMLDLVNLCSAYGKPISGYWREVITRMFNWLAVMTHPDGDISFFNDAAMGIAPRMKELVEYATRLKIDCLGALPVQSAFLADSGYARIEHGRMVLLADVGSIGPDYLPGHAHADTLSFELSLDGRRVVVNSGTSLYGTGEERQRQRGTAAHNTVRLDNSDSSEVWAGFRVARRAKVRDLWCDDLSLSVVHDGYTRLPGKPLHFRQWTAVAGGLEIIDEITGKGEHFVEMFLHFHPDWCPRLEGNAVCVVQDLTRGGALTIHLEPALTWRVEPSTWHPQFGVAVANFRLVGVYRGVLPQRSITRISWSCASLS